MRQHEKCGTIGSRSFGLAALVLLGLAAAAPAQISGGVGGGQGGGSGVGGGTGAGGGGGAGGGSGIGGGAGGAAGVSGGQAFSGGQALQGGLGAIGQQGAAGQSGGLAGQPLTPGGGGGNRVGSTSFMGPYFVNPLSFGLPSNATGGGALGGRSAQGSFGQPLYNSTTTGGQATVGTGGSRTGTTGNRAGGTTGGTTRQRTTGIGGQQQRGVGGGLGYQGGQAGVRQGGGLGALGGNTTGVRAQAYYTELAFVAPTQTANQVIAQVQNVIGRTASLPSRGGIRAVADGDFLVLRGSVATERERRLAEAVVRLSPGVFNVRNELEVNPAPPPRP